MTPTMPRTRRHPGIFLRLLLCALSMLVGLACASAATLSEQRTTFRRVLQAQAQGEMDQARALAAGLEDYALYPYFRYEDLRLRLRTLPQAEVEQFLTTYADSLLATQLRTAWLRELARAEQWANFVHFWQAQTDEELICQHFVARWRSDHRTGLFEDVKAVWLSPDLHAAACDEPFEHLYASASMNDALIWQRVRALMRVGESSRARSTATHFKAERFVSKGRGGSSDCAGDMVRRPIQLR